MGQGGRAKNVGKDRDRVSLARISVHGAKHQVKKPFGAWRSRHQSIGQPLKGQAQG